MAQNMDVAALQAHLQQTGAKWQARTTALSTLSLSERQAHLGAVPPPGKPTLQEREQAAQAKHAAAQAQAPGAVAAYPASFDLRDANGSNYITPIEDQGNCGSCVAFGTTATVEAIFRWEMSDPNLEVDLSEAHLWYCFAEAQDGRHCNPPNAGWWPDNALNAYQNSGTVDAACFSYTAGDQPCNLCSDWQNRQTKITGWHTLSSIADMKTWLSTRGPLTSCFTVYDDFYSYSSGVYTHVSGNDLGGHCICIVGYDDNQGCWICKNSWGADWGENGFFRIAYGQCGIDAEMWAVEGVASIPLRGVVHLETIGDVAFVNDMFIGTRGQSRRVEGFQIQFNPPIPGLSMRYMAHLQDIGDVPWVDEGQFIGTRGQSRRLEGFAIELTGPAAANYTVRYMAHLQDLGDTGYFYNGQFCGTRGQSRRVEGMLVHVGPR